MRTLFDDADPDRRSLQAKFEAWDRANPHVFLAFAEAARALKRAGRKRYGAKAIYERMRFDLGVRAEGDSFSLNNNWTSRLARKLLVEFPGEFDDFLELRRLKTT